MRGETPDLVLSYALWDSHSKFLGVFWRDLIPLKCNSYPCAFVANTAPSSHPGRHLVGLYHRSITHLEFFESSGHPPKDDNFPTSPSLNLLDYNSYPIQSISSSDCGQYCIFYLIHRTRGILMPEIINILRRTSNPYLFVRRFVSKYRAHMNQSFTHSFSCNNHQS